MKQLQENFYLLVFKRLNAMGTVDTFRLRKIWLLPLCFFFGYFSVLFFIIFNFLLSLYRWFSWVYVPRSTQLKWNDPLLFATERARTRSTDIYRNFCVFVFSSFSLVLILSNKQTKKRVCFFADKENNLRERQMLEAIRRKETFGGPNSIGCDCLLSKVLAF